MKKVLSRFFPVIVSGIILLSMMFSHSCANTTQAPTGGKRDSIPPVVLRVSPENYSTNIRREGTEISFTFDEYVNIKTPHLTVCYYSKIFISAIVLIVSTVSSYFTLSLNKASVTSS